MQGKSRVYKENYQKWQQIAKIRKINWGLERLPHLNKSLYNMNDTTKGAQPKMIYQIEATDLEQLIIRAVVDAMSQYCTPSKTQAVADSPEMLTRDEAAKFLHVTTATLSNWAKVGYLIPTRVGRRVLYPVELLRQFANSNNK